ncbi:MAG: hypothetical protein DMF22_06740 [Verrucomicrobia bacterium]|nr:MAG: hypothetical protein DMF22_06740 [Verrucomicrobiota bacterium]
MDEVGRFPQNLSAKPTKYFANVISRALRDLGERAARAAILMLPNALANRLHSVNQPLHFFARRVTGAAGANHGMFARSCMLGPGNLFRSCDMFIHMITYKSRSCDLSQTQQVDNRENGSKICAKAMLSGMIVQGLNFQEVYRST